MYKIYFTQIHHFLQICPNIVEMNLFTIYHFGKITFLKSTDTQLVSL